MTEIKKLLLTQKEVLEFIGIKKSSLYHWINKGTFPKPLKLGERLARCHKSDIENWFNEKRKSAGNKNV